MKVLKLDPNTLEVLDTYKTLTAASKSVNCSYLAIRRAALEIHRYNTAKGYLWFVIDEKTGLNHYDLLKNEEGNNLSLEEVKELLKQNRNSNNVEMKELVKKNKKRKNSDNPFVLLKLDPDTLEVLDTYDSYQDVVKRTNVKFQREFRFAAKGVYKGNTAFGYRWFALNKATGLNHYEYSKYDEIQPENGPYISLEELKEILIRKGEIKESIKI